MKLCFIADARSPIAQNWIRYFINAGHEVQVISTYPCEPSNLEGAQVHIVPVAFSSLAGRLTQAASAHNASGFRGKLAGYRSGHLGSVATAIRHWLGPLDVYRYAGKVMELVEDFGPELVHAMRIPFEGLLAAVALKNRHIPLLISVWGNDFTLFANRFPLIALMTKMAMQRADALHPDCYRDLHLARKWGFAEGKPVAVLPGSGGVQTDWFCPGERSAEVARRWGIPDGVRVVLNPRGFRDYVRNETFFRSIPLVLKEYPNTVFLGLGMRGNRLAQKWIVETGSERVVHLLPSVGRDEMADLFRLADLIVSPSIHDGTPNSLLEGMACGTFPVAGDIDSIREWITDGHNGLLCDPESPASLAASVVRALGDDGLRRRARDFNQELIRNRADYATVMKAAVELYGRVKAVRSALI